MKNSRLFILALCLVFSPFVRSPDAAAEKLVVGTGNTGVVRSVAISPDGRFALSGDSTTLKLWEIASGRELRTFTPDSGILWSVDFSPDGRFALGASDAVEMWEIATGAKVRTFSEKIAPKFVGTSYSSAEFSADGKYVIASERAEYVHIWNAETGERIHKLKSTPGKKIRAYNIHTARLSPDSRYAASGGNDAEVKLWDATSGKLLHRLTGHKDGVWSLAFALDGRFLLSGGKKKIKLWEVTTGKLLRTFDGFFSSQEYVTSLTFSPDGRYALSTNGKGEMVYWDVGLGKKRHVFEPHDGDMKTWGAAAISPDGKYALHGRKNIMKLWRLSDHEPVRELRGYSSAVRGLYFTPNKDNQVLSALMNDTLKYWDLNSGQELHTARAESSIQGPVSFSPDGKALFFRSDNSKAVLADAYTGKTIRTFWNDDDIDLFTLSMSPDGRVAVTFDEKEAIFWDARTGDKLYRIVDDQILRTITFTPDSRFALIGGERDIKIWRAADGQHIRDLVNDKPGAPLFRSIAVSADGRLVMAGALFNPKVFIWDFASGKILRIFTGHKQGVVAVAFSPDASRALSSGFSEQAVMLWDVTSGELLKTFSSHSKSASSVVFSPDGRYGLSGGGDGIVYIYDIARQKEIGGRAHVNDKDWVFYTADGRFDGSANGVNRIHFVRGLETFPLDAFYEKFYTPNLLAGLRTGEAEPAIQIDISREISFPPLVEIISPEEGETLTSEKITLEAKIIDQGSGIEEVRLYQNEKLVTEIALGITDEAMTHRFGVLLIPGKNNFRIIALNKNRTESKPALVAVIFKSRASAPSADLHLLAIGINKYKNSIYNLNYGRPDAKSFSQSLAERGGHIFKSIVRKEIYDEQAVKPVIEKTIQNIISMAKPEDVFVFYYAGHGVMSSKTQKGNADFYLVPHDVTQLYGREELLEEKGISAAELKEWFKLIPAQKQLVVLDACQAGGAVETFARRGAAEQKAIAQLARSTGIVILASSGTEQFASEFRELGHGLFTYALLQALSGQADGGNPPDRKITVKEVEAYINDRVPELAHQYRGSVQYPNSYAVGNDFPLALN